jgi:hypothetical protein
MTIPHPLQLVAISLFSYTALLTGPARSQDSHMPPPNPYYHGPSPTYIPHPGERYQPVESLPRMGQYFGIPVAPGVPNQPEGLTYPRVEFPYFGRSGPTIDPYTYYGPPDHR